MPDWQSGDWYRRAQGEFVASTFTRAMLISLGFLLLPALLISCGVGFVMGSCV